MNTQILFEPPRYISIVKNIFNALLLLPFFAHAGVIVDKAEAKNWLSASNVYFEENKGQFLLGDPSNEILYKASLNGTDIAITEKGLSYSFYKKTILDNSDTTANKINWECQKILMNLKGAVILKENIVCESPLHANNKLLHCRTPNRINQY